MSEGTIEGRKKISGYRYEASWRHRRWKLFAAWFMCLSVIISPLSAWAETKTNKGKLVLVEMNWISQVINTKVAEIILREKMGYDVEVQRIDFVPGFQSLARGDADVLMEIWDLTGSPFYKQPEKEGKIVLSPNEGMKALEGWYVPSYVIRGDPKRGIKPSCPGLPDWRALNDCAKIFSTAETEPKGRYLSGDPSWAELYGDPQRIKNLGLNYDMRFAGSEAALVAEIFSAYERGEPIMALMWDPHYVLYMLDMTLVKFPPYTEECWGTTYACAWKDQTMYNGMNGDAAKRYPEVWEFIQNFHMTREHLGEMMVPVAKDGITEEESVRQWLTKNEEVWRKWIPKAAN
ncbi:glycine betaine ABC transporter substrate-binding protein [Phyllobacterium zundukense]|uniref:ABC-type glycine betaine transport system substrate-binding domain-containing protein n=1 Tax=Phyllobacterium zundukense TaxID=1867719 RepID=A0A2N9VT78_9HYPH|nr:glycine betaine ABC transporter substrate-binding protein [Phyllobacterium zundukense]ATU95391.1 hypothetical protein BLM14_27240 [Phyllobacterium zundukense]PIO42696.1 hypothetical protein B5P45_22320 [Phyllobacterium zundukense]